MNSAIVFCVLGFVALITGPVDGQRGSAPGLERLNVDAILRNPKMVQAQLNCVVYDGRCDQMGSEIKRVLPIVGRDCRGCTPMQRRNLLKIFSHIQQNYPQAWNDLLRRYGNV